MDTRTGELLTEEEAKRRMKALSAAGVTFPNMIIKTLPANFQPTKRQIELGKIGRNDRCPCGSGKKFKKCCWTG